MLVDNLHSGVEMASSLEHRKIRSRYSAIHRAGILPGRTMQPSRRRLYTQSSYMIAEMSGAGTLGSDTAVRLSYMSVISL